VTGSTIDVSWQGQDDPGGSGIGHYDVYVSTDGGPFELWVGDTTENTGELSVEVGRRYAFFSVATDNVGHRETPPDEPDAVTVVVQGPELEVEQTEVQVTEGRGAVPAIRLRLTERPDGPVTVNLAWNSGDADISVAPEDASVTFDDKNWRADRYIKLIAAPDEDTENGAATIVASADGVSPLEIQAHEKDKDEPLGIELRQSEITVPEGRTGIFQVNLTAAPPETVTVTTVWTSGDMDLSVDAHESLQFDSTNWDRPRWIAIAAAEDGDFDNGTATFTVSAPGLPDGVITAGEQDLGGPAARETLEVLLDDYVPIPLQGAP
jgi:hypothetical protein